MYNTPTPPSDENTIAAILAGIGAIIAALGIPKIIENIKFIREQKYTEVLRKLEETKQELVEVKKEMYTTKAELKKVRTIVSVVLPMMKLKNQGDPETIELIRIFERESGINVTSEYEKEKRQ